MSWEGMDVDRAQGIARTLDGYAQALSQISAALARLAAELGQQWNGPAAAMFQQQWAARYRPALVDSASALADMHAHLIANIQQQIQASAASTDSAQVGVLAGAGSAVALLAGTVDRAWQTTSTANGYVSLVTTPLEQIHELAGDDGLLHDSSLLQRADHTLTDVHGPIALDALDKVTGPLGYVSVGVSGAATVGALSQHHYASAANDLVTTTANALETSKDPVAILAGFDVGLLQKDVELAHQIQWSQGIPNPFGAGNFKNDYVPMFKSLPGEVVSTLAEVI